MEQPFVETAVDLLYCFRVVMLFFREIYKLCCETNCYFHEPRQQLAFAPSTQHEPKIPYTKNTFTRQLPGFPVYLTQVLNLPLRSRVCCLHILRYQDTSTKSWSLGRIWVRKICNRTFLMR